MPTDDELLDFDVATLGGIHTAPRTLLQEHGDAYRNHLRIARWLDQWAGRLEQTPPIAVEPDHTRGVTWTLRDVSAHLRQGDFLDDSNFWAEGE